MAIDRSIDEFLQQGRDAVATGLLTAETSLPSSRRRDASIFRNFKHIGGELYRITESESHIG